MPTLAMQCITKHGCNVDSVLEQLRAIMCGDRGERKRVNGEEHWHQCGARAPKIDRRGRPYYPGWDRGEGCGAIWSHRGVDVDDTSPNSAHRCPKCNTRSVWAYTKGDMEQRNRLGSYKKRYIGNGQGLRQHCVTDNSNPAIFPVPSGGHG